MLNDIRAELTTDFVNEFGVTEMTAAMAAHLFLAVTASVQGEKAQEMEFQRALQQAVTQGESWATEMVAKMLEKRMPARESADGDKQRDTPSARPALADIHCFNGQVTVTVDPTATVASARVHTKDSSGPTAKAARDAVIRLVGDRLTVTVPEPEPTVIGNNRFSGGVFQNVTIDENGNITGGGIQGTIGASPIEIDVTLPPGSAVKLRGRNPSLTVHGPLAALDAKTYNGKLRAGIIGKAKIRSYNGKSTIDAIQDGIDSETYNGVTTVGTYSGVEARLSTHNGTIHLTASRRAHGEINARTYNGSVSLLGVAGRTDLQVSTSAYNGRVTKT
ncbi:hypothetical protein ACFCY8_10415 [Streptomyces noursei]|uniref:hypothetical protein n=1 Tax=Streptomyces noursei TaxID=1971 RepID=UPI0035DF5D74